MIGSCFFVFFWGGGGEGGCWGWCVSWVESQRSMLSISLLVLTSKIYSIPFVIMEGS